ncbi:unnamed protein product [Leuciscus chuanchicus]
MGCGHGDSRAGVDSELTPLTSSVCKPASEEDCEKLFIACFAVKDSSYLHECSPVCFAELTPLTSSVCKPAFEEDCEKLFIGYFAVKDSNSLCVSPPLRKTVRNCHWLLHSKRIQLVILSPVPCVCPPLGKTEGKAAAVWWAVKDLGQKTHAPGRKPPPFLFLLLRHTYHTLTDGNSTSPFSLPFWPGNRRTPTHRTSTF